MTTAKPIHTFTDAECMTLANAVEEVLKKYNEDITKFPDDVEWLENEIRDLDEVYKKLDF